MDVEQGFVRLLLRERGTVLELEADGQAADTSTVLFTIPP